MRRVLATGLLLLEVVGAGDVGATAIAPPPRPDQDLHLVERVVDGDTIIVAGLGRVRLLGVDAPESVKPDAPVDPFGPEAAKFTKDRLDGRRVRLEFDTERIDDYGRRLAYVFLPDGGFFNALLVEAGLAVAFPSPALKYRRELLEAEDQARRRGAGVWSLLPSERRSGPYRGNRRSRIYHAPGCRAYRCPNCIVVLPTRRAAEEAGFRPHRTCLRPL
ncbi:MAG: hypothetical protein Kow00109_28070 [Acidobacteriota bacterium]